MNILTESGFPNQTPELCPSALSAPSAIPCIPGPSVETFQGNLRRCPQLSTTYARPTLGRKSVETICRLSPGDPAPSATFQSNGQLEAHHSTRSHAKKPAIPLMALNSTSSFHYEIRSEMLTLPESVPLKFKNPGRGPLRLLRN